MDEVQLVTEARMTLLNVAEALREGQDPETVALQAESSAGILAQALALHAK